MSYEATRWAMAQDTGKGSRKLVLIVLADCVNAEAGEMTCWPSLAYLGKVTELDVKTLHAALEQLAADGWITDTGNRVGSTGRVRVWRLNTTKTGAINPSGAADPSIAAMPPVLPVKPTENGGIQMPPKFPANGTEIPSQSHRNSQSIPPETVGGTGKEPGTEPGRGTKKAAKAAPVEVPGVEADLIAAWQAVRRAKRAGPINDIVLAGLRREAGLAGISVADAIRVCCEAGWQGFNHQWYAKRTSTPGARPLFNPQQAVEDANRAVVENIIAQRRMTP